MKTINLDIFLKTLTIGVVLLFLILEQPKVLQKNKRIR